MIKKNKIYTLFIFIFIIGLFIDQFSKNLAVHFLQFKKIIIFKNILSLSYLENRGVGFGLFQNRTYLILVFNIIILTFLTIYLFRIPKIKKYYPISILISLIITGAIGNIIDRIRLGYVIDFICLDFIDFPIFNMADMFVSISVALLLLLGIFKYSNDDFNEIFSIINHKKKDNSND